MPDFMHIACEEARRGIESGDGGPFGAVVVKDGTVISSAHNMVLATNDSTAHAEIVAIRKAEQALRTYDLSGCEMYATSYPCPMCLAAVMWARIGRVTYQYGPEEAARLGFDDQAFHQAFASADFARFIEIRASAEPGCAGLFERWLTSDHRRQY
ncbi:MAG: nucleoside deaminase [Bacillota bacterium]|nr:nucleoside deaminase [Bacillota bacterium]